MEEKRESILNILEEFCIMTKYSCKHKYGVLYHPMEHTVQPIRIQESHCILDGIRLYLPIVCCTDCVGQCVFYGTV